MGNLFSSEENPKSTQRQRETRHPDCLSSPGLRGARFRPNFRMPSSENEPPWKIPKPHWPQHRSLKSTSSPSARIQLPIVHPRNTIPQGRTRAFSAFCLPMRGNGSGRKRHGDKTFGLNCAVIYQRHCPPSSLEPIPVRSKGVSTRAPIDDPRSQSL